MIGQNGYKRFWDKRAKAPYLFNRDTKVFVTYDDEKSVTEKIRYIKKHKLAGIFFWEYSSDPKEYLLNTIHKKLP
jgi:chitinase